MGPGGCGGGGLVMVAVGILWVLVDPGGGGLIKEAVPQIRLIFEDNMRPAIGLLS